VAHVELSLSDVFVPVARTPTEQESDNFEQWCDTVSLAAEPCLLIDAETRVAAVSTSGCELLCLGVPGT
jgi:hypothetical protein